MNGGRSLLLDPSGFIYVAARLAETRLEGTRQESLRRAISTTYYAVFHAVVSRAVDQMVGSERRDSPRYTTLYRAFEHRRMRQACEEIIKPNLAPRIARALGSMKPDPRLVAIAATFLTLQDRRHWADYAPIGETSFLEVVDLLDQAQVAISHLDWADEEQTANWFSLMIAWPKE